VEHIVVDDGSTDDSWAVLQSFADRISTVRLARNRGGAYARNRGAEGARGEFLMFLDADDLIAPDTLAHLVAAVRNRMGAIATCPWQRLRLAGNEWVHAPAEVVLPLLADPLTAWLQDHWVPPCAVLWTRNAYERAGGWDERITRNQDGDLMMRAFVRGSSLVPTAGGQAVYRHHAESRLSLSNDSSQPQLQSLCRVLENVTGELRRAAKLPMYRALLGEAYYKLGARSFEEGAPEIGRECVARAMELVGRRATGRTWVGRLLTLLLGLERKERLAEALASIGIMTPIRRRKRSLRRLHARRQGS
jgi:glycosyltransferase involved in cell wall biosynthesis